MKRVSTSSVRSLAAVIAVLTSCAAATAADTSLVFADSFDLAGDDRAPGTGLSGQSLEQGEAKWAAGPMAFVEGGGVSGSNWNGSEAHHRLPRVAGRITSRADFRLTGVDTCVGIAIGGNIGGNFFRDVELNLIISPTGGWELNAPRAGQQRLASGDKSTFPDFDPDGLTTLEMDVDTIRAVITARINGKVVVDALDATDKNIEIRGGTSGFRINGPAKPGDPLVRNYRATVEAIATAGLRINTPTDFIVEPGVPAMLTWQAESIGSQPTAPLEVRDYWGKTVAASKATMSPDGSLRAEVTLEDGYYEIWFPEARESFGVVALPKIEGKPDPFFGMDAALSELERRPEMRRGLAQVMRRSGIAMARERYNLGMANHGLDVWQWDAGTRQDEMRRLYAEAGLDVLEMIRGGVASPHLGVNRASGFYRHYPQYARSFKEVARRYGAGWAGCEVWNEPDHGATPADQYVTMVKAAAYGANEAGMTVPLVSGVFAAIPPGAYFDTCAANGMLDHSDAVSFHSYDDAMAFESVVWNCRQWLRDWDQDAMPIWITECGKPWTTGPSRATMADDAVSAYEIVMKGIEAKACGVANYHPFVLVAYAEGNRSFGMMGREVTPMRSYAAYARSAVTLREAIYIGDLHHEDEAIRRARVFATPSGQWVAVLFTGRSDTGMAVDLPIQPVRVEGIDGRSLPTQESGKVPVPDGLAYVWLDPEVTEPHLIRDTRAAELLALSQGWEPRQRLASSIVLEYKFEDSPVRTTPRRYIVAPDDLESFRLTVRVHNLDESTRQVTLEPQMSTGVAIAEAMTIEAQGMATTEATWTVNLLPHLDVAEVRFLTINAKDQGETRISALAIPLITEGDLPQHLARHTTLVELPVRETAQWSQNIVGHGRMTVAATDDATQINLAFSGPSNRWAFPQIKVPANADLSEATGMLIRARIARWSRDVGLLLWLDDGRESFELLNLFPPDGNWHVVYVPFEELRPRSGHPDAQNARFDPHRLRTLALGMVTGGDQGNLIEISDVIFVSSPGHD